MNKIQKLSNAYIQISVNQSGAELHSIKLLSSGKEYLWDGNSKVWSGRAPILFPIVGALKNSAYFFRDQAFTLPQHGFFRRNDKVELVEPHSEKLTYILRSDDETKKVYPFDFEFYVSYELRDQTIAVNHRVVNIGKGTMYFSLGGHPAFKCPVNANEEYSDYYIEFEKKETVYTFQITDSGLIGGKTDKVLDNSKAIDLHYHLFDKGALVFKDLKSRKASLVSRKSGKKVEVRYPGWPYLGIWAKPNADYVCIEPWLGIADSADADQQLTNKEGILTLEPGNEFEAGYEIEVF